MVLYNFDPDIKYKFIHNVLDNIAKKKPAATLSRNFSDLYLHVHQNAYVGTFVLSKWNIKAKENI